MTGLSATQPEVAQPRQFAFGLGANLGEAEQTLHAAIIRLSSSLGPLEIAPLYRSDPISPIPQPDFFNTVVSGHTLLEPEALLAIAKQLELDAGRHRGERWGPRELDVDLLLLGSLEREEPELTLPHPRLRRRRFVLAPLADLHPHWWLPPDGATPSELLAAIEGTAERVEWTPQ